MGPTELKELLAKQPFEPIALGLSDGRDVLVRHPDQIILTGRHAILGLAQVKNGKNRLRTPAHGDRLVKDWLLIDLLHIVSAEPADGNAPRKKRGRR